MLIIFQNILEEDKIDEHEAVYLYQNQLGKFNTTFEEEAAMIDELENDEIYVRENSN